MTIEASESGRESVWDYPRPPRLEAAGRHIVVEFDGRVIADSRSAYRVLETSHPPTYYVPPRDVVQAVLVSASQRSFCEFKGWASYWSLRSGERLSEHAAWYYPDPTPRFEPIKDHLAFYPGRVDACYVDGERVQAQDGDFYGGWITAGITGPFKGAPGTKGW